jgi:hypothetical protein
MEKEQQAEQRLLHGLNTFRMEKKTLQKMKDQLTTRICIDVKKVTNGEK